MKLIVGLGNVGRKYEKTRHNVGFEVLDTLARRWSAAPARLRFDGQLAEASFASERVLLLWPGTLMNLSGRSVGAALEFYQLELGGLLVVCDDFNLPLGKLRLRSQGSCGGQKGLEDVISRLGSDQFGRLRIGIGPVPERWDPADFVLNRFNETDRKTIDEVIARAADGVECWVAQGIETAMNEFN
jgi:PTH1 family peptidyl-tRNA hydrolase